MYTGFVAYLKILFEKKRKKKHSPNLSNDDVSIKFFHYRNCPGFLFIEYFDKRQVVTLKQQTVLVSNCTIIIIYECF